MKVVIRRDYFHIEIFLNLYTILRSNNFNVVIMKYSILLAHA